MHSFSIVAARAVRLGLGGGLLVLTVVLASCSTSPTRASSQTTSVAELAFQRCGWTTTRPAGRRAGAALRTRGASTVPELIELLHAHDSALTRTLIARGAEKLTTPASHWHAYAASALVEIGPPAASAEVLAGVSAQHRHFVTTRARAALIKIRAEPFDELERALDHKSPNSSTSPAHDNCRCRILEAYYEPLFENPLFDRGIRSSNGERRHAG
ncbi:MAG: hypothetical protein EXS36_03280 [Pedosphaera sp.]|nr:hypothetical protein [Pedosphaera sp.]